MYDRLRVVLKQVQLRHASNAGTTGTCRPQRDAVEVRATVRRYLQRIGDVYRGCAARPANTRVGDRTAHVDQRGSGHRSPQSHGTHAGNQRSGIVAIGRHLQRAAACLAASHPRCRIGIEIIDHRRCGAAAQTGSHTDDDGERVLAASCINHHIALCVERRIVDGCEGIAVKEVRRQCTGAGETATGSQPADVTSRRHMVAGTHINGLRCGSIARISVVARRACQPLLVDSCILDACHRAAGNLVDGGHHGYGGTCDRHRADRRTCPDRIDLLRGCRIHCNATHADTTRTQIHRTGRHVVGISLSAVIVRGLAMPPIYLQGIPQRQGRHLGVAPPDDGLRRAVNQIDHGTQTDADVAAHTHATGKHVNALPLGSHHADVLPGNDLGTVLDPRRDRAIHLVHRNGGRATNRAAPANAGRYGAYTVSISAGGSGRIGLDQQVADTQIRRIAADRCRGGASNIVIGDRRAYAHVAADRRPTRQRVDAALITGADGHVCVVVAHGAVRKQRRCIRRDQVGGHATGNAYVATGGTRSGDGPDQAFVTGNNLEFRRPVKCRTDDNRRGTAANIIDAACDANAHLAASTQRTTERIGRALGLGIHMHIACHPGAMRADSLDTGLRRTILDDIGGVACRDGRIAGSGTGDGQGLGDGVGIRPHCELLGHLQCRAINGCSGGVLDGRHVDCGANRCVAGGARNRTRQRVDTRIVVRPKQQILCFQHAAVERGLRGVADLTPAHRALYGDIASKAASHRTRQDLGIVGRGDRGIILYFQQRILCIGNRCVANVVDGQCSPHCHLVACGQCTGK